MDLTLLKRLAATIARLTPLSICRRVARLSIRAEFFSSRLSKSVTRHSFQRPLCQPMNPKQRKQSPLFASTAARLYRLKPSILARQSTSPQTIPIIVLKTENQYKEVDKADRALTRINSLNKHNWCACCDKSNLSSILSSQESFATKC